MNRRFRFLAVSIVAALTSSAGNRPGPAGPIGLEQARQDAVRRLKAMPLAFEANVGQTASAASYVARGQGYAVWATADGPVLRLGDSRASKPGAVIRLRVVRGDVSGHPSPESALPGAANYFIGNDPSRWKTGVPRFGALRYPRVYPGVDLVLHGTQESLEYDFVVAPHADPSPIGVAFDGAETVRIEPGGNLTLTVDGGEIGFRPPVAYQERNGARELVDARYEAGAGNVVRFALGEYDRSQPLTIDPVLSYSTYLGGTQTFFGGQSVEIAHGIAVDAAGNAYLAGFTNAVDFPMTGSFDTTCGGCTNSGGDAWVAKIDPSQSGAASLVFMTYLGANSTGSGTGSSIAYAVAADSAGNVYVTGNTSGYNLANTPANEAFPTTANAFQPNDSGDLAVVDAFLTKLDPTGSTLLYSTYLGGNNVDEGSDVKVDDLGNAFVVGWSASSNFSALLNGFKVINNSFQFDGFVAKIATMQSGAASLKYGTLVGGGSSDRIGALAVDAIGRVYVTGYTQSQAPEPFPVLNGFQTVSSGGQDTFMTMINPALNGAASLLYSTLISSNGTENASLTEGGIALTSSGLVYVTGSTFGGSNFPTTPGAYKSLVESTDAYVVKIDPSQVGVPSLLASTLVGGISQEAGTAMAVDQSDNPVLGGWSVSPDFGVTGCAMPKLNGVDGFVMVLDPSLTGLKYSTPLGGSGTDRVHDIGIGPSGEIYAAGYTESANFPTTPTDSPTTTAAFDPTQQGSQDAFLTVISSPLDACPVAPLAAGFNTNTPEDTPKPLTLTATDPGGNSAPPEALTWTVVTQPAHGTLDVQSGAMTHGVGPGYSTAVLYTPASNYTGPDSFQFIVNDGTADSNVATVTISVTAVNDPPTADSQNVVTAEETPKLITLSGSDPENLPLTYSIGTQPQHGILSGTGASRTYTPAQNFSGQDSFTFFVTDWFNLSSTHATVTITVTNVNDGPVATADAAATQEDVAVTVAVLANDTDPDGDPLSVSAPSCNNGASVAVNPDQMIKVTPAANFNGTVTCSYTAADGNGETAAAQLTVTVSPVNDDPAAAADGATTPEDVPVTVDVLANDTDIDGDVLSVNMASCNNGAGAAINPNKTVSVTPALNFIGTIACVYTAGDGQGGAATGQLTVAVTPVNDSPIATPDVAATDDNTLIIVGVLSNDVDPDGDPVFLLSVGLCQQGTLTANLDGTVTYAPKAGFDGTDVCTYTATDGQNGVASGQLTVSVTEVNAPPSLDNPGDQQTAEGTPVSLQLIAGDPDGDPLTFTATGLPPGLLLDATGLISGAPAAGSAGSHQVSVTVNDGQGGTKTVNFVWVVTPPADLNQPPVCSAAQPSLSTIWPLDHRLVPIQILGVTDPNGGQPTVVITRILQDEPTNTFADGTTWIDGFGVGTSTAQIRAERTGNPRVPGDGRVYEIFFTATDAQGATCSGSVLVSVPRDQSGHAAVDSSVRYESTVAGGQPINK